MIAHYLKTSFRALRKNPLLSTLNIVGLSVGLGCFLVIVTYLYQENTYEKGFTDYDRIYRLEEEFLGMGRTAWSTSNLQYKLNEIPEIESYVRLSVDQGNEAKAINGEKIIKMPKVLKATDGLFEVFDFSLQQGDVARAIDGPNKAVLTKDFARRLFATEDVMGKTFEYMGKELMVTGVLADQVFETHLKFDFISSNLYNPEYTDKRWWGIGGYIYIKTTEPLKPQLLNKQLDEISKTYVYPVVNNSELSAEEWLSSANKIQFFAKPIRDIYLGSNEKFEIGANGDKQTRVTLSIIGIFILVIAIINFMNLTTARSSLRTKEIGLRKVLGTRRGRLVFQFLTESTLITLFAALIGAGLSELFITLLNQKLGEVIGLSILSYPMLGVYILLGVLVVGFLAGIYPAFYLSSVKMIPLLKGMKLGQVLNLGNARTLRNGLVVLQFTISSTLIIGSYFVYSQLQHLKSVDVGFDKEQVLVISHSFDATVNLEALRNELLTVPGVEQASFNSRLPADRSVNIMSTMLGPEKSVAFNAFQVDPYYAETLGLQLLQGKWFSPGQSVSDSLVVLNRAGLEAVGLEGDPVGQVFGNYWRVIGVVEDFIVDNYREQIGPAIMTYDQSSPGQLAIKLSSQNVAATVASVQKVWEGLMAGPFEYKYLDQNFTEILNKEKQNADAVLVFTILAIFISCLGLFGLAAFMADQRAHEFGIRKVLGASVADIVRNFGFDFTRLIVLAFVVAIPVSVYAVNLWLNGYANRIELGVLGFVIAALLSFGIAFLTIAFQSLKAGRLNPVKTLRNE
ncbi:FtsX-like permease family protein [Roseivirga sp. UBA1976]|uniref:FtsX-like permease family protein n=1 Tax=Roseivirga sp. UBA1976 TaxID=1947386 RepID=UPI00257AC16C|nr:FtsX-like permease family protein [Roseivirga sp. UBA1976]MEC7753577.1 FtsX-like permease family protein [Bacteroidota bacterium]